MNIKKVANIIIRLRQEGWSEEQINDFMIFVETHVPTADEAEKAKMSNR
ncbi:MAG: hypothetical protein J6N76_02545 [Lachnospiraceae bacterium]|nr:hypothetical protein [Lachnospiraceae bacterium]